MTQLETARIKEVLGTQIGVVQECAHRLQADGDLEKLGRDIGALEEAIAELKKLREALP